jgi:hypothetical protein
LKTGLDVYPVERLYEEVAFVAYHFNWDRDTVLKMPHGERQRWCEEISAINERINRESGQQDSGGMTLEQEIPDEFWEDDTDDGGDVPDFWGEDSI